MWIKICGIRDVGTARRVAEIGVDAIGLNFYERSPRNVSVSVAAEISRVLPAEVARVGVFVNRPIGEVESIAVECRLDHLQLHGDEPPSYLADLVRRLPQVKLIRSWRMGKNRLGGLRKYVKECRAWKFLLAGCLVDSHVEGVYGGSGIEVPWDRLVREYDRTDWPPLILAGGLNPNNIAQAIMITRPWGVDVASGVESSAGVKDIELVRQFVQRARLAAEADDSSITAEIPVLQDSTGLDTSSNSESDEDPRFDVTDD